MTNEKLERGQNLLKDIKYYERLLQSAEKGELIIRYAGNEYRITEDIIQDIVITQIKKDLSFLKERFENL